MAFRCMRGMSIFHSIASLEGRLLKVYFCSVNKVRSD